MPVSEHTLRGLRSLRERPRLQVLTSADRRHSRTDSPAPSERSGASVTLGDVAKLRGPPLPRARTVR